MRRVNLGGSSHLLLLTLLGPHQLGKPDQWGALGGCLVHMGLAWSGFCLALRVTSGLAFLPLFPESLVTCAVTLGTSQAPNKETHLLAHPPRASLLGNGSTFHGHAHLSWQQIGRQPSPPSYPSYPAPPPPFPVCHPGPHFLRAVREWQFLVSEA